MKIEKVNENQIRCTLTKEDLADRQIKISELAYGTDKAKELFQEMMQQASYEFGFEAEDIPLMIEAIPLSPDTVILLVTKVEYPDELDTRFSKFSDSDEDDFFAGSLSGKAEQPESEGADHILDLFRQIEEEHEKLMEREAAKREKAEKNGQKVTDASEREEVFIPMDITKIFVFRNLEQIASLARVLNGFYQGENDIYKNPAEHNYYLVIRKSSQSPEEFNKVCNILAEYANQANYTDGVTAYFKEHFTLILKKNAVQTLAGL